MNPAVILLAMVTIERLAELWLAHRNTRMLLAQGAFEVAPEHYRVIVLLHALWLGGLWLLGWSNPLNLAWLLIFLVLQGLRVWVLMSLGRRWTTRIIIVPGAPLVSAGPYRYLAHPNYVIVIGEIAVLPLCLGLPWYALAFSAANAAILAIRIRSENVALGELRRAGTSRL
ncbi:putative alkylpyrone methyltransferase BpsB [Magnetospirillum gryphiswaldense MSR-1 v2]|uniref:Alkylpyrone methyltransferase BpsB n=1 Tax=Magnetospirillum gryphiswaldense (strain DSM 6361 / JCM 21280 / NBRC 15271 / MSR-1) TaxID=431944 RepID=V6F341_MAGGM|nr:isoprenylcysteine carboxylmethyltransferase family protein [Magnetospirillum gryphiswaldense]CDK98898.1 putative alkylpyrone methyltransferase BpsB [Magnetospirillum gryphiswaldense MSR-1 v2]